MPNWRRIKKLRDHIASLKPKQVDMSKVLYINRDKETLAEARQPECGTVGCLAGHGFCLFGPARMKLSRDRVDEDALTNVDMWELTGEPWSVTAQALDMSHDEAFHMFYANWHPSKGWKSGDITKREVLRYLDKAIKEKNIIVTI